MSKAHYQFVTGTPDVIQQHSIAKHEVLREYLIQYILTLAPNPSQDEIRFTLVDGFAGGGVYVHETTNEQVLGSPFVMLQAVREAEVQINQSRSKPLRVNVQFYFIEKKKAAFSTLQHTLKQQGYEPRISKDIHLLHGAFNTYADKIIDAIIARSPQAGRSIFFLDQYGYRDVPTDVIQRLFKRLPRAEVLLTFGIDSLINFISDKPPTAKMLSNLGLPNALKGRSIAEIKASERDSRLYIQALLYKDLTDACTAQFFTPFFIRTSGHGNYWLLHLSQHQRARDVMTKVHWQHNNHFIHYGGAGINMFHALGYSPSKDDDFSGQLSLDFRFDDVAKDQSVRSLMEQLPPLIHAAEDGISFSELFARTCNLSPADSGKYREAIAGLARQKEIIIKTSSGGTRHSPNTIDEKDILLTSKQNKFIF